MPTRSSSTASMSNAILFRKACERSAFSWLPTRWTMRSTPAWSRIPRSRRSETNWASRRDKMRSEEHTSELQSRLHLVCRLLLEKKKTVPDATLHLGERHPPGRLHASTIGVRDVMRILGLRLLHVTHQMRRQQLTMVLIDSSSG